MRVHRYIRCTKFCRAAQLPYILKKEKRIMAHRAVVGAEKRAVQLPCIRFTFFAELHSFLAFGSHFLQLIVGDNLFKKEKRM